VKGKPLVFISACLGFAPCRYDGKKEKFPLPKPYRKRIKFLPFCPEEAIGLGTPRLPIRIIQRGKRQRLIQPETGLDLTRRIKEWSEGFLKEIESLKAKNNSCAIGFLLKSGSPSCALRDAKIYSAPEGKRFIKKGSGFFGRVVLKRFKNYPIFDERELKLKGRGIFLKLLEGR
jgi:uncharacterized protein YbbK (DUF523 family)